MTARSAFSEAWLRHYQARIGKPVPLSVPAEPANAARDAAWLRDYERKEALARGVTLKPAPALIEFAIRHLLRLPNRTNGRHWVVNYDYRRELLPLIADATEQWAMCEPIQRARVTITRHSTGVVDDDNLAASVKPALDILLARTATHPHSLGLLVEDDPARVTLLPRQERVSERRFCRTTFLIEATP